VSAAITRWRGRAAAAETARVVIAAKRICFSAIDSLSKELIAEMNVRLNRRNIWSPSLIALAAVAVAGGLAVNGRATSEPFPDAPRSQHFSPFGPCPLASANRYLPKRAGCVTVRRADANGDGRIDLVLLYARLNTRGLPAAHELKVVLASGGTLTVRVPRFAFDGPTIMRLRNLNARPGVEIVVHEAHSTTEELAGVYAIDRGALRRAGGFAFDGEDGGIVFGFTCHTRPPATIVQHEFDERIPFRGVWDRTDTNYHWVDGRLRRSATRKVKAKPSRGQIGVHC
jgi:hypothetical protein